jgi:predicted lipoprotein with Yx(FWY)xxD motif
MKMAHGQNAAKWSNLREINGRRADGRFSYTTKNKWTKKWTHRLERLMAKKEIRDARDS